LDPGVAPRRIFVRHPDNEALDLGEDHATTSACPRGPFPRHELAMPAQQRVGRRDRGDLAQSAPTDADGADGEPTPIGVRQPDSSRPELPTEQPVFDDQVGDDFAFAVLEPTG